MLFTYGRCEARTLRQESHLYWKMHRPRRSLGLDAKIGWFDTWVGNSKFLVRKTMSLHGRSATKRKQLRLLFFCFQIKFANHTSLLFFICSRPQKNEKNIFSTFSFYQFVSQR